MSYTDFDHLRETGIDAIVNLCGEFCDLHEIEEQSGFEVYYLPIPDECAPDLEAIEQALGWLDEALHIGKKILIHCRYGMGRTDTFVFAYLLHCGFDLMAAGKKLEHSLAIPTRKEGRSPVFPCGREKGTPPGI